MEQGEGPVEAYVCGQCGSVAVGVQCACHGGEMEPVDAAGVVDPELSTLLRHVFGISPTGIEICVYLMDEDRSTIDGLSGELDVDRSTVSRQLDRLTALGVVERHAQSLAEGGQRYEFSHAPPSRVKKRLREALLQWATDALAVLEDVNRRKLEAANGDGDGRKRSVETPDES